MSMVFRTVNHLNQAKAETTDSERCDIKTETGTGTANEEGANTSNSGKISIGYSGSIVFGSGEADSGGSGSITVLASGNTQQKAGSIAMASSSIQRKVIIPRQSKRVPKGLCDQAITNPDSSAAVRSSAIDNSTPRGVTRKRSAGDSSTKSRKKGKAARTDSFEQRYKELIAFIDEFGHCNVPCKYSVDPSFGNWCGTMRFSYNQIQQGRTPKYNLTQDQIERLEEIGLYGNLLVGRHFSNAVMILKHSIPSIGHCNVPCEYSVDPSLGKWCGVMRYEYSYNKIQQGQTPTTNLTPDQIQRLDEIGFIWKFRDYGRTFEQRCHDLEAFKSEFRHCNVSRTYLADPSLGNWCSRMRGDYNEIQQGQAPRKNLTPDQIERLEEIGFK
jgi:hypothetical protein